MDWIFWIFFFLGLHHKSESVTNIFADVEPFDVFGLRWFVKHTVSLPTKIKFFFFVMKYEICGLLLSTSIDNQGLVRENILRFESVSVELEIYFLETNIFEDNLDSQHEQINHRLTNEFPFWSIRSNWNNVNSIRKFNRVDKDSWIILYYRVTNKTVCYFIEELFVSWSL